MDFAYEILLQGDRGVEAVTGYILNLKGAMDSALEAVESMEPNALQITIKKIKNDRVQPSRERKNPCCV